jgi:hypothetical protein
MIFFAAFMIVLATWFKSEERKEYERIQLNEQVREALGNSPAPIDERPVPTDIVAPSKDNQSLV